MAFDDLERKRVERAVRAFVEQRRPPPHIRPEVDIAFCIDRQSVLIFETRPMWREPDRTLQIEVAKATYVRTRDRWHLFWMRADLKWHRYQPLPEARSLKPLIEEIDRDPYCCFWG